MPIYGTDLQPSHRYFHEIMCHFWFFCPPACGKFDVHLVTSVFGVTEFYLFQMIKPIHHYLAVKHLWLAFFLQTLTQIQTFLFFTLNSEVTVYHVLNFH